MLRFFLLLLFIIHSLAAIANANELVLNLDKQVDVELIPYSQYLSDNSKVATVNSIRENDSLDWASFKQKQIKQGFINKPLWVRTELKTVGNNERDIVLILHQIMDHVTLVVSSDGEKEQQFELGKGTPRGPHHLEEQTNLNHAMVKLKPGKTYQILLGIKSENPVVGTFRAVDVKKLQMEADKQNQWVLTFILLIFLVSFYNFVIYITTKSRAFLYHVCYVMGIMSYLLNDHGYLAFWFNLYDAYFLQKLTAISIIVAYTFMVLFFDTINGATSKSPLIVRLNKLLLSGSLLLLISAFLLPYDYFVRLLSVQVLLAIAVGIFISFYHQTKLGEINRTHKLTLRIIMMTFAPSVVMYILNRIGVVNTMWYTDFLLFLSTFVEVVLISLVLFVGIRQDKEAFRQELYFNSASGLPNARALEEHFQATTSPAQQTLIQIWVSDLGKLEVAFGPLVYRRFITDLASQIKTRLIDNPLLIQSYDKRIIDFPLFHCDKNTFSFLCQPLNTNHSKELLRELELSLDAIRQTHHKSIKLNFTIGAHAFHRSTAAYDTVIRNTSLALSYGIKNNLKFKYYNPQIGFDDQKRITLLNDFIKSLKSNEFFLLWQPQYETKQPKISGAEVLTRWQHPQYGLIGPDEFIPILEQSQHICELSHWIIGKVFEQLPLLHKKHPKLEVSVNLSPRDLLEDGLVEFLDKQSVHYAQYIPYITLEITETLLIDDYSKVLDTIKQLQTRGYNISIDDFGSGYASFAYLQKLPANELKIDKSYTDCYKEHTTFAILESIIELAKRLGMRIVVEGIEHQQQIDLFTSLGAERLQGWKLGKPMTLESLLGKV